jgi:hypothetical protein
MNAAANALGSTASHLRTSNDVPRWVESAARAGYTAKGIVYALVGAAALRQVLGSGEIRGSREALRDVFSGPFGKVALALITVGLIGYVVWRLVQAFLLPGRDGSDNALKAWGTRAFYLVSAAIYGVLCVYSGMLLLGSGDGGSSGGGSNGVAAELMSMPWGVWLVGATGAGIIVRGLLQGWKAYTQSFRKKIDTFKLGARVRTWVMRASRVGLTARGIVFAIIGYSFVSAALNQNADQARGTQGALEVLTRHPWLLALVGAGLICYAVYQWTKARYRLIGVS